VTTRRRTDHAPSHERWLVSYADFITLLFAFFTMLYASSTLDAKKLTAVVDSMKSVFAGAPGMSNGGVVESGPALLPPAAPLLADELAIVKGLIAEDLRQEISEGRVTLDADQRGLVVSIREAGSFPTGSADLPPDAEALFAQLARRLRGIPNAVRVEGHTDDVPIRTARYASNWELSTARATRVVAFLMETADIDPRRLSAAGYGEFHPVAPNASVESRARNRRVDLVVLNASTRSAEEPAQR
jgi:chemotaxis protein MotB